MYDIVFMDIELTAAMSGLATINSLRNWEASANRPVRQRVCALTSRTDDSCRSTCLALGMAYASKPANVHRLLEIVKEGAPSANQQSAPTTPALPPPSPSNRRNCRRRASATSDTAHFPPGVSVEVRGTNMLHQWEKALVTSTSTEISEDGLNTLLVYYNIKYDKSGQDEAHVSFLRIRYMGQVQQSRVSVGDRVDCLCERLNNGMELAEGVVVEKCDVEGGRGKRKSSDSADASLDVYVVQFPTLVGGDASPIAEVPQVNSSPPARTATAASSYWVNDLATPPATPPVTPPPSSLQPGRVPGALKLEGEEGVVKFRLKRNDMFTRNIWQKQVAVNFNELNELLGAEEEGMSFNEKVKMQMDALNHTIDLRMKTKKNKGRKGAFRPEEDTPAVHKRLIEEKLSRDGTESERGPIDSPASSVGSSVCDTDMIASPIVAGRSPRALGTGAVSGGRVLGSAAAGFGGGTGEGGARLKNKVATPKLSSRSLGGLPK